MADNDTSGADSNLVPGQRIIHQIKQLRKNYEELISWTEANSNEWYSIVLGDLMRAQIDEAKEAKKTSVKLGQLSQLAYIFLPLQLTASAMGMNLENFGTGNIKVNTFVLTLAVIAALSFTPIVFPQFFGLWKVRLWEVRNVARYSRRAGFLYGWFCLCHRARTNDILWDCGIGQDVEWFRGSGPKRDLHMSGPTAFRTELTATLRSPPFAFFPRYWQGVLDELYNIIDTPQWGRKDTSHHTA